MMIMKLVKLSLLAIGCLAVCCYLPLNSLAAHADEQSQAPLQLQPAVDQLADTELESFGSLGELKKLENDSIKSNETTQQASTGDLPHLSPQPPPPASLEVPQSQPETPEVSPSPIEVPQVVPSPHNNQTVNPIVTNQTLSSSTTEASQVPAISIDTQQQQQQQQQPISTPSTNDTLINQTIITPTDASNTVPASQPSQPPVAEDQAPLEAVPAAQEEKTSIPAPALEEVVVEVPAVPMNLSTTLKSSSNSTLSPPAQIIQPTPEVAPTNITSDPPQESLNQTSQTNTVPVPNQVDINPANQVSAVATPTKETVQPQPEVNTTTTTSTEQPELKPAEGEEQVTEKVAPNEVTSTSDVKNNPDISQEVNQEKITNSSSSGGQVLTNSIPVPSVDKIAPANLEAALIGATNEELDGSTVDTANFWFTLDKGTCGSIIPEPILNQTVAMIFSNFLGSNCTQQIKFKLGPFENRRIRGNVMETSATVLSLSQLLEPKLPIRVQCYNISSTADRMINFSLNVSISSQDAWLESRWRKYQQTKNLDEIPLELPGENGGKLKSLLASSSSASMSSSSSASASSPSAGAGLLSSSSKCQRFKVQGGTHEFGLSDFEGEFGFLASLKKLGERAYQLHQLRVHHFRLNRLHLAPSALLIDGAGQSSNLFEAPSATVQILHDQNNHHRRNNWLLDLYANWLRHEYRGQLRSQLSSHTTLLVERLNGLCKLSRPKGGFRSAAAPTAAGGLQVSPA